MREHQKAQIFIIRFVKFQENRSKLFNQPTVHTTDIESILPKTMLQSNSISHAMNQIPKPKKCSKLIPHVFEQDATIGPETFSLAKGRESFRFRVALIGDRKRNISRVSYQQASRERGAS